MVSQIHNKSREMVFNTSAKYTSFKSKFLSSSGNANIEALIPRGRCLSLNPRSFSPLQSLIALVVLI